jgi:hypothetical protein
MERGVGDAGEVEGGGVVVMLSCVWWDWGDLRIARARRDFMCEKRENECFELKRI